MFIALAVALGLLAFFGNLYYLQNNNRRAYGNAKLVNAVVVTKDIPKGTSGEQAINAGLIKVEQIPQQFRPGSAITQLSDVKGNVALTSLAPGQVIVTGQFVSPALAQTTSSQRLQAGKVAITLQLDQTRGVGGLLMPGDYVNVMVSGHEPNSTVSSVRTLYQNVPILAIGTAFAPQPGDTASTTTTIAAGSSYITFAVPLEAAERITLANTTSGLTVYLALVTNSNQPIQNPPVIDSNNLFSVTSPTP